MTWEEVRPLKPAILMMLTLSGCASEDLLVWPAPPPGSMPTLTVQRAEDPAATAGPREELAGIRSALPPALVSSLRGDNTVIALASEKKPSSGTTGVKIDPDTRKVAVAIEQPAAPPPSGIVVPTPSPSIDPPVPVPPGPPVVPPAPVEFPIDLSTALRLAEVENPEIAETRMRIQEAMGILQGARVLAIPTLNAGLNYHGHTGNLQRSSGRILSLSEQSLYYGGGSRTLAAESLAIPAVNIVSPLADVLFEPLVARQEVDRSQFDYRATTNSVLLEVARLHFELIGAEASLLLRRETEAEGRELARLTEVYASTGQGRQADADRAGTLALLLKREVQKAEEEVSVASTRLAHRLHLDPVVRIRPIVARIEAITLIDERSTVGELINVALQNRPEIAARAAAIGVAETRFHQERARPLLPLIWVGFSGGAFGGGANLVPPLLGNFGGRTDFDVRAFWTLQNLGFGNLMIQKQRRAEVGIALGEQSQTINMVRRQVGASLAEAIAARGQVEVTEHQLATAVQGFQEDLTRIRGTVGLPIEVTNSLELLSDARQNHLNAIINYNLAQFKLFVSLGSPPPLERPDLGPLPPAPVAYPPLPLPPVSLFSLPGSNPSSSGNEPTETRVPITPPPLPMIATSPGQDPPSVSR